VPKDTGSGEEPRWSGALGASIIRRACAGCRAGSRAGSCDGGWNPCVHSPGRMSTAAGIEMLIVIEREDIVSCSMCVLYFGMVRHA
jgi:hypothetical protein